MVKYSHTKDLGAGLTYSNRTGLRFTKRASSYNTCVASELRGSHPKGRKEAVQNFKRAVAACRGGKRSTKAE